MQLQHKKLEFEYKSKDKIIFSDKEKLKQILIILIDNAIKYTNNEDIIKVTIYDENTNIIIDVLDTGIRY
ncbi:ATP-binding protein [Paraclostridium bifermentans]|nr:ATP-binding protein [Paraclostridium bifermentans]